MDDSQAKHDWKSAYPQYADSYTPEEWEEYNTNPVGWCIKELESPDSDTRFNAIDILRGLCPDAEDAIVPLTKALCDSVPQVRAHAAFALVDFAVEFKAKVAVAVVPLTLLLSDEDSETRSLAAEALGAIGPSAVDALEALSKCEYDPDTEVSHAATRAVHAIKNG